jgi:hypothetical protein
MALAPILGECKAVILMERQRLKDLRESTLTVQFPNHLIERSNHVFTDPNPT